MSKHPKLAKLEALIAEQDAEHEAKQAEHEATIAKLTGGRGVAAYIEEMVEMSEEPSGLDETDGERLELLDRIAARMPDIDLDKYEVAWTKMPDDGSEALVVEGGGIDGGNGFIVSTRGDELHVVGPMAPLAPGMIGCVVISADGGRRLGGLVRDPKAGEGDEH